MFRDWIKQQARLHGLSQRALGRAIGMSQSYVSDVINGKKPPSVEFCLKLAETFEETPEYVLRLADILPDSSGPDGDDPTLTRLLDLAGQLTPERRKQLLDFARFLRLDQDNSI